ncbi:MAG TPA: GNAT family N-acetyltransferase [Streptosporangiaceae bacterium]|nr:GNAT family N-acetyltransferase [Streptosporangiaceae bacterium]
MTETAASDVHVRVRLAVRADIPGIVQVASSSILPGEDAGFGGRTESPFCEASVLAALWQDPNVVQGEEVLVAEMGGRIVGCVTVEDKGRELELVNIDVPLQFQGRGIGTMLVRWVEERARAEGKQAVTAGTSRNAQGVAWKSLPWWQHLGYQVTHEEENAWTRSIGPQVREIRLRKELPAETDSRG